jgi:hypothetical protein
MPASTPHSPDDHQQPLYFAVASKRSKMPQAPLGTTNADDCQAILLRASVATPTPTFITKGQLRMAETKIGQSRLGACSSIVAAALNNIRKASGTAGKPLDDGSEGSVELVFSTQDLENPSIGCRMAFPLSITGHLTVRDGEKPPKPLVVEHLRRALLAQSVDLISVADDTIRFRPQAVGNEKAFRPDGVSWMFHLIGPSLLVVDQRPAGMRISYQLSCRFWFYTTTLFSVLAGIATALTIRVETHWAVLCTFASWTMLFASGYLGTRVDFRHWLGSSLPSYGESPAEHLGTRDDTE